MGDDNICDDICTHYRTCEKVLDQLSCFVIVIQFITRT